jgi:hypothetical protein
MGGCGLSNWDEAVIRGHYFEKRHKLEDVDPTLKEIGEICKPAERSIARFGKERMGLEDWAVRKSLWKRQTEAEKSFRKEKLLDE